MRLLHRSILLAALSALLITPGAGLAPTASAAPAAQTNLLTNPSFEGSLSGWATYWVPGSGGCGGQTPTYNVVNRNVDANRVKGGDSAAQVTIAGSRTYQAGFQQTVNVTPGQRYRFSAWVHVWSTASGANPRQADGGVTANEKIGIDPTGQGPFASSATIVWSS
ncbi:MAG: carbohydrate binding domain-containing protein, partial [Chloroflexi bacterium]|nr:carbohydrate binding domain-containing protein [Chloroflexota bacterium]